LIDFFPIFKRLLLEIMADKLVTQVSQNDDPAKQQAALAAAKKLAEEKKPAAVAPAKDGKGQNDKVVQEKEGDGSSCWRYFCCCFGRRAPKRSSSDSPSRSAGPSGGSGGLVSSPAPVAENKWLLPPLSEAHKGRKTLVLDLDETLVHSSFRPVPSPDFIISIELDGVIHKVYVQKRPGVDEFLEAVAQKFELIIFTASLDKYANPVLNTLDPKGYCTGRLFREACVQHYGNYVKDLSQLGRELKHTLILDNSPFSYMFQPDNAIPITSWFNDRNDRELYELIPFLNGPIAEASDVSQVIVERKQLVMQNQQADMMEEDDEEETQ